MKQTAILYLILFMLTTPIVAFSQVTITVDDFIREATIIEAGVIADPNGVAIPTTGPNQVWDYTGLTTSSLDTAFYFDASGNVYFPDALNYRNRDLIFQGFLIKSYTFDDVDNQGYYEVGRSSEDISYSITAISGGPNDSLGFVSNHGAYDGRVDFIQFPLNYQDQWNQTRIETINFELTVAGFGLDHVPGARKRHAMHTREVVGHGQLTIPTADGSPSPPMDVLLIHATKTEIDSFYLGGALAPAALLGAFGLTQGSMTSDEFYVFYRRGYGAPVMNVNVTTPGVYYRPHAADGVSGIRSPQQVQVESYPNPVQSGGQLNFQSEEIIDGGQIQLVDMIGRVVFSSEINSNANHTFQVKIPRELVNGVYSYQILNDSANLISTGMIHVESN